jgi:hypothetical protein
MGVRGAMHQTAFLLFCRLTEVRLEEFRVQGVMEA